jgi:hypothetical protein
MLEIRPPALCADRVRAPSQSRSHSCLCSVQCAAPTMSDRVIAPGSDSLRTAGSWQYRATDLESDSCTSTYATRLESYPCEKSRGASPPSTSPQLRAARVPHPSVSRVRFFHALPRGGVNLTTPLLRAANLSKLGVTARRFATRPRSELCGVQTRQARSSSPLECSLTQKEGWGVPPSRRFLE